MSDDDLKQDFDDQLKELLISHKDFVKQGCVFQRNLDEFVCMWSPTFTKEKVHDE